MGIYREKSEGGEGTVSFRYERLSNRRTVSERGRVESATQDASWLLIVHFSGSGESSSRIVPSLVTEEAASVVDLEGNWTGSLHSFERGSRLLKMDGRFAFDALFRPLKNSFLTNIVPYSPTGYHPSGHPR